MSKVKLSDNKVMGIDSMIRTVFQGPSGTPISAREFMVKLFGDLSSLFNSEDELRRLWSIPSTRKKLLQELNEKGYMNSHLETYVN
jgi:type I restriction enzyme R subunit